MLVAGDVILMCIVMPRALHDDQTKKVGRTLKAPRLKRTRRLRLLLTRGEFKALREYSERRQMTASEVMRACLRSLVQGQPVKGGTL